MVQPLSDEEFKRLCWQGFFVFMGGALVIALVALGEVMHATANPAQEYPAGRESCAARYLGEIAYWAEAPDNRMICQRLDRNSMRERKCVGNVEVMR